MPNLPCITRSHMQQQEARRPRRSSRRSVWSQHVCMTLTSQSIYGTHLLLFLRLPQWAVVFLLVEDFFHLRYCRLSSSLTASFVLWIRSTRTRRERSLLTNSCWTDKEGQRVHLWNELCVCNFTHASVVIKYINSNPQILRFIQFIVDRWEESVFIWPVF